MEISFQLSARFWSKVAFRETGCWEWQGGLNNGGYGLVGVAGRTYIATHVALTLAGHPRPRGLFALHSCHNRACVNPLHLRWGTAAENMDDAVAHGSMRRAVPLEKVERVRRDPRPVKDIADEFGCSPTVIYRIKDCKTYKQRGGALNGE